MQQTTFTNCACSCSCAAIFPRLVPYLFLMAPFQLAVLNPIGYRHPSQRLTQTSVSAHLCCVPQVCNHGVWRGTEGWIEDGNHVQSDEGNHCHTAGKTRAPTPTLAHYNCTSCAVVGGSQNVATNPIVLFTVLGLLYNLATGAKGTPLWAPIDQAFETAGNGFTVCALFMLGAGMYGNLGLLKGKNLVLPMLLSLTKVALVAIAIRLFMNFFTSNEAWPGLQDQKEFSYIYGDSPALCPSPPPPRHVAQHSCAW